MTLTRVEFGDSISLDTGTIVKTLLNGDVAIYQNEHWPVLETLSIQMKALSEVDKDLWRTWLIASAGQNLALTDHNGIRWQGFVIGDPEIIEEGLCKYSISFQFQGKGFDT